MDYKWQLRHGGGKEICPKCGQRRFVPYVSTADGVTMAGAEYGRCDREQNCGYHRYPNKDVQVTEATKIEQKKMEPLRFYPASVRIDTDTALFVWTASLMGMANAIEAWNRYKVGRDGKRTVFWQIAKDGTVRAGKSILYGEDGHRIKTGTMPANWLHRERAWDGTHTGEELQQCYFGEHLLNGNSKPVVIVESEKTAVILSQYSKSMVWLASGGSQGVKNEDKNKALAGRDVWMLPDNGQYWAWSKIAHLNGWRIYDQIEKYPIFEGCDILDMIAAGVFGDDLIKRKKKQ